MSSKPLSLASSSVGSFCERNSISVPTFYKEVNAGRLRTFKVGRKRLVSAAAEREWIADREREAQA